MCFVNFIKIRKYQYKYLVTVEPWADRLQLVNVDNDCSMIKFKTMFWWMSTINIDR